MTRVELGMTIEHNGQPKLVQEFHQFPELVSTMSGVEQKPGLEEEQVEEHIVAELQELPDVLDTKGLNGSEAEQVISTHFLYLREIARYSLLSAEEEIALARTLETGEASVEQLAELGSSLNDQEREQLQNLVSAGEAARHRLIESNLRLVVSIAQNYDGRGLSKQDLIQEGNLGLYHAVTKYDWRKGYRFSTYAFWWIRQAITRAILDKDSLIHVPVYMHDRFAGAAPTEDISRDKTPLGAAYRAKRVGSLNTPLNEDGDVEVGDLVPDKTVDVEGEATHRIDSEVLLMVLDKALDRRERRILMLRFGFVDGVCWTLEKVGDSIGVTRERVRQIENQALRKLRAPEYRKRLQGIM